MIVIRRRLIFWLIKAYIKKSGKTMLLSFIVGLIIFFGFAFISQYANKLIPIHKTVNIGVVGTYTQDNLPDTIVSKIGEGLTSISANGSIKQAIADKWQVLDSGKTYKFSLKRNLFFSNGQQVTSDKINYNFSDVSVQRPDKYTIIYKLKEPYAPFLVTVSQPIFNNGYSGVGEYQIIDIKLNGNFLQSLTLRSVKNRFAVIQYIFYPTEEALKLAYGLGEITEASQLHSVTFAKTSFDKFPNITVKKTTDYAHLVTLFYNTQDRDLSDKKLRLALSYALPETFAEGEATYLPYSPKSLYFNPDVPIKKQDLDHARVLMGASNSASGAATPTFHFTLSTIPAYRPVADEIAASWKQVGIDTKVQETTGVPAQFQIFLGDFNLPNDPDQYTIWHSDQNNNITKYKNLRIDKLLEDGRKTIDVKQRKKIYDDFQKYLMEDEPASFLYFPYRYDVLRK